MNRFLTDGIAALLITGGLMTVSTELGATVYLNENFEYETGNLYKQGNWVRVISNNTKPIQVVDEALTYPGYQTEPVGKSVTFGYQGWSDIQILQNRFVTPDDAPGIREGAVYYSAIVRFNEGRTSNSMHNWFMGFTRSVTDMKGNIIGNPDGNSQRQLFGALFAYKVGNDFKIGIIPAGNSGNSTTYTPTFTENNYPGDAVLVVVKYEFGQDNSRATLWVNPPTGLDRDATEEDYDKLSPCDIITVDVDASLSQYAEEYGISAIVLSQDAASKRSPNVTVDALRVADSWAELFNPSVSEPADKPEISLSETGLELGTYQGVKISADIVVKAKNLSEDITVGGLSAPFSASASVIPAAEAMSTDGYTLTVTLDPQDVSGSLSGTLTLTSGETSKSVDIVADAYPTVAMTSLAELYSKNSYDINMYIYKGEATVTHTDAEYAYIQDENGATCLSFPFSSVEGIEAGDKLTDFVIAVDSYISPLGASVYYGPTVVSKNNPVTPTVMDAADLLANIKTSYWRLVTIENVEFDLNNVSKFDSGKWARGTSSSTAVAAQAAAGSDLIGTDVPEFASITGIVRSASAANLILRSKADITEIQREPELTVVAETLFDGEAAAIGSPVVVARFTVDAKNLTRAADVYLTGAGRSHYSISAESVPAGTGTTVLELTYDPTAIGKHDVRVNIDATPTELSWGTMFTGFAYDPANPPAVTVSADNLTRFEAAPGQQAQQTITVTTANFPDYPSIKAAEPVSGVFIVNSTTLLKSGENKVTFTFAPKNEGEFSQTFTIDGIMFDPVTISMSGIASEGEGDKKQGNEYSDYNPSFPLTILKEDFSEAGHNKPVDFDRWLNVADLGTRAWWGYSFPDGNRALKATAYDSKVEPGKGTPLTMTIVTPPLSATNSANNLLTFRVMGENLTDDMTDQLELLYVIEDFDRALNFYTIEGISFPATADESGKWVEYVMDLGLMELDASFAIAFRFSSTRGRDNSAIYYIDDLTYGSPDVPFISPTEMSHEFTATAGSTMTQKLAVIGKALSSEINLAITGDDADCFTLSTATLPAIGGLYTIDFVSSRPGIHQAQIILTSEGAPASLVNIVVNNIDPTALNDITTTDGIHFTSDGTTLTVTADRPLTSVTLRNTAGSILESLSPGSTEAVISLEQFAKGVIIVTATTEDGIASAKLLN